MSRLWTLLDGTRVDISALTARQQRILRDAQSHAQSGVGYSDLLAALFHPLSPLWEGRPPSEQLARKSALFQVLPDVCARVAIESTQFERDYLGVSEFARIKGASRQAVYAAAARGEITLEECTTRHAVVVDEKSRRWFPSAVRQQAGRQRGRGTAMQPTVRATAAATPWDRGADSEPPSNASQGDEPSIG